MKNVQPKPLITRESVLKLLTEAEVASVTRGETSGRLSEGEEYIDLKHVDRGVRRAGRAATPTARVLPRKSVPESTWLKITEHVAKLSRALEN